MGTERLSEHFTYKEFACHGINCCNHSTPHPHPYLILGLEELRSAVGNKPIIILSGYRCNKYNYEIGGTVNSYHCKGMAVDICVKDMNIDRLYIIAEGLLVFRHGGIGKYKYFLHLDIGECRRWKG